jgi:hypothetical protein
VLLLAWTVAPAARAANMVSASGWLDGLAVVPTEDSQDQRPQLMGMLRLEAAPYRWLHGRLELRGRVGGPFEGGPGPGVWNFDQEFQNRSPSLDVNEGWVEFRATQAEVRLGIQTVAWGKLDGIPPTDVINPRDYHDPIVQDAEERKIGVPAALGTWYLPDVPQLELTGLRTQLMYIPIAVPPRLALVEERWFPSAIGVPSGIKLRNPLGCNLPPLRVAVDFGTANDGPARSFENQGIGFRTSGTWRNVDWDLMHYTGPETSPDASLIPVVVGNEKDPNRPFLAITRLTQEHDTIHMTGADAAFPFRGFTVRAEGAWFVDRPYLRPVADLVTPDILTKREVLRLGRRVRNERPTTVELGDLFPDQDSIEWGLGLDYLWNGFQPILQVNQIVMLDDAPRLLIGRPDTRILATLRKQLLDDRLELEMRGVYQAERGGWFVMPRISYLVRDDFRVRLAYLAIGGSRNSLIGQFHANDEVVFQARYSF